ncbi:MAG: biopolymer transporter ExbD [Holophagales bacterium]|jgi:biopolymer transport protein ExbD|nr:biopolymer transporter ExbD [Holophagales bacterium]
MYQQSFEDDLDASLDLTPLIDTVFILLLFFILTTTFSKPMLEVLLAKADSASVKELIQEKLTITITEDGRVFFEGDATAPEEIAARMEKLPIDATIVFNVDKESHFGLFVQILDTAKSQGRSNFLINTGTSERKEHGQSASSK